MRITIATGPFLPLPPAPCGAVERRWYEVGKEFSRRGHRVTFLCCAHPTQNPDETADGVRYIRRMEWKRSRRISLSLFKDLLYSSCLLTVAPPCDIFVTNAFWLPALASWLRLTTGKVVVNVARMPKRQMWLYLKADRLSAVSSAVGEAIAGQCPAAVPLVKVIPNPVDTRFFKPPSAGRSSRGERTLLYTGRIHPEKGLHLLLDAFALLDREGVGGVRLKIVGPARIQQGGGGRRYLALLREKARGLPVEFLDPVYDRGELAKLYQTVQYYCYPSLAEKGESFGVAPLEAMACGIAPVVSDLACFRDFIDDGETGWVFNHRAAEPARNLCETLKKVILDASLASRAGARAAERAARFSVENVASLYLADFEELLNSRA